MERTLLLFPEGYNRQSARFKRTFVKFQLELRAEVFCTEIFQEFHNGMLVPKSFASNLEWTDSTSLVCASIQVRSILQQKFNTIKMTTTGRLMNWLPSVSVFGKQ